MTPAPWPWRGQLGKQQQQADAPAIDTPAEDAGNAGPADGDNG